LASTRDGLGVRIEPGVGLINRIRSEGTPSESSVSGDITSGITVGGRGSDAAGGVETFERDRTDHIAHLFGELFLFSEFEPGGSINGPAINLRSDTPSFFNQQLLDFISRSHISIISFQPSPLAQRVGYDL